MPKSPGIEYEIAGLDHELGAVQRRTLKRIVDHYEAALTKCLRDKRRLRAELIRHSKDRASLRAELAEAREAKDGAYEERNRVVALLASIYPSGIKDTNIEGWDQEWHGCVYIDSPAGQLSWHFHESQRHLFADLPAYQGEWDGHTTEEKYERIGRLAHTRAIIRRAAG